jgi:hypothetical protein
VHLEVFNYEACLLVVVLICIILFLTIHSRFRSIVWLRVVNSEIPLSTYPSRYYPLPPHFPLSPSPQPTHSPSQNCLDSINNSRMFCVCIILEVVLRAFPTTNQDIINEHVGSYMRHAPSKPGCPKHKVCEKKELFFMWTIFSWPLIGPMDIFIVCDWLAIRKIG